MRWQRIFASILSAVALAGCSAIPLPQRGFATRFVLRAIGGSPVVGSGERQPGPCEAVAAARAQDVASQHFGTDVQQQVYDSTLRDCRIWRGRAAGP